MNPLVVGEDAIGMYHPVIPATNIATPATLDSGVFGLGIPGRPSGVTAGETATIASSDTCGSNWSQTLPAPGDWLTSGVTAGRDRTMSAGEAQDEAS